MARILFLILLSFCLCWQGMAQPVYWIGDKNGNQLDINSDGSLPVNFGTGSQYIAGNVGIGSTSPERKLVVVGDMKLTGSLYGASGSAIGGWTTETGKVYTTTAADDVGIGTSTPAAQLQVGAGTPDAMAVAGDNDAYIAGHLEVDGGLYGSTYLAPSGLNFDPDNDGTNEMVLTSAGNVGIGSTIPGSQLDIRASDPVVRIISTRNSGWAVGNTEAGLDFRGSDGSGTGASIDGFVRTISEDASGTKYSMAFGTNNNTASPSEVMRLSNTGNVGIGSTNPGARLSLVGTGTTSATSALMIRNSNATALMTVLDNGNVGIGTTAPPAGLSLGAGTPTGTTGATSEYVKDNIEVDGFLYTGDTTTGGNAGTDLCIDADGALCVCGSCK